MNKNLKDIKVILATDCGSTTTKAILIEFINNEYRLTFRGEAPTTVEAPFEDVTCGVINAIIELEELSGRKILIDDIVITQPGTLCNPQSRVRIKEKKSEFVSRGGDKLHHFIEEHNINIKDKCCLDIGISTGGFTDVLLRRNALHILGIDVGYGILEYQLRKNKQLSLLERTNAREVSKEEINENLKKNHLSIADIQLVVMDVSFISVFKILPNLLQLLNNNTEYIILIKPQFEAEKDMVDMGGIITNQNDLNTILKKVEQQFNSLKLNIIETSPSKIKGAKGNQETFYYVSLTETTSEQVN